MAGDLDDELLMENLRLLWLDADPAPDDLADRMVASVAMADFTREWEVLALVEDAQLGAVRGEADTSTLQFSDGVTNVLLHVAAATRDRRRVDGWVDSTPLEIRLSQNDRSWQAVANDSGRFAFETLPRGVARLRLVVRRPDGSLRDFETPQFEV
ncbi:MAG: hypothetical protein VB080_11760 [Propionicimonas sp.]|uniref:hypothetical protein n=1 Tax=Propionicimonas sp. TaxID=1955623 RepID=UPI002B1F465B|nr:hypothetical protein [Propionicimonas sp.]MEA4945098.1 hypothetical protein [Propionicimonas sp.]MEA5055359.1 hypothetical protein [Propionicimonas sp.]MEA5116897.1 hypothetical protein [Propionicimonas sp.]